MEYFENLKSSLSVENIIIYILVVAILYVLFLVFNKKEYFGSGPSNITTTSFMIFAVLLFLICFFVIGPLMSSSNQEINDSDFPFDVKAIPNTIIPTPYVVDENYMLSKPKTTTPVTMETSI